MGWLNFECIGSILGFEAAKKMGTDFDVYFKQSRTRGQCTKQISLPAIFNSNFLRVTLDADCQAF